MKYFTGCTALITGVTAGIGEAIAIDLAPHAHTLILVARRTERLQSLERKLLSFNPRLVVHCRSVDLADETQIDALTRWLHEDKLNVNLLINNAGLGDHGDFAGAEWDKLKRIISVNITALAKLTWALLPVLHQSAPSTIINVSSIAGFIPVPTTALYAASKAFVTSLSEALRAELRGSGISVTTVCPGPVDTEFGQVAQREGETHHPPPAVLKIPASQVARESLVAAANNRARVVPGFLTAIAACIMCLLPMFVVRFLINRSSNL
jgi:hypothetical protein